MFTGIEISPTRLLVLWPSAQVLCLISCKRVWEKIRCLVVENNLKSLYYGATIQDNHLTYNKKRTFQKANIYSYKTKWRLSGSLS